MRVWQTVVPALLLLAAAVGLLTLSPAGGAACAAPPPGWHRTTTIGDFGWLVAPVALFLGGEYLALGAQRRSTRVVLSVSVVVGAAVIGFFSLATAMNCGTYAP